VSATADTLRAVADGLDDDAVFDIAAGAIADISPRSREASDCINAVIAALRAAADKAAP
jgi:hypothetical protein